MPASDVLRFRAPPAMRLQLEAEARARQTDVSDLLRQIVKDGLQRRGHKPIETGRELPAVDHTLRLLAHGPAADPLGGPKLGYTELVTLLNAGFVGKQASRGRGRLDYCLRRGFVVLVRSEHGTGGYHVDFAKIHLELCGGSCQFRPLVVASATELGLEPSSGVVLRTGGESYGSERS